jgi:IMP cyclohydrolase
MNNPIGPYPGRQIFIGKTINGNPCLAYLITGRSPESRQRRAVRVEDVIRIGPLGDQAYDALRHYNAVKFDRLSGVLSLSNGIQTDASFEMYKLIFNVAAVPVKDYLESTLEAAGAEPDSYHTPRIGGIITFHSGQPVWMIGIKAQGAQARAVELNPGAGKLTGVATYQGFLDSPEATSPAAVLPVLEFNGKTAEELGKYVFDISAASYKGNDIRVCTISGIYANQGGWTFYIHNVQE